jgi:hypothetical protein
VIAPFRFSICIHLIGAASSGDQVEVCIPHRKEAPGMPAGFRDDQWSFEAGP